MSIHVKPTLTTEQNLPARLDRPIPSERRTEISDEEAYSLIKEALRKLGFENIQEGPSPNSPARFCYAHYDSSKKQSLVLQQNMSVPQPSAPLEDKVTSYVDPVEPETFSSKVKRNLVATQGGLVTFAMPIYIALEKIVLGYSDYVSQNTRGMAVLVGAAGLTALYQKNRRKVHQVAEDLCERFSHGFGEVEKKAVDMLYGALFTAGINPIVYAAPALYTGTFDGSECAKASVLGFGTGACLGVFLGCGIDLFQDLWGYRRSGRVADSVRFLPLRTKRIIANGLCATSLALSSILYNHTEDNANYGGAPHVLVEQVETYYGQDLSLEGERNHFKELRLHNEQRREQWEKKHNPLFDEKPKYGI